METNELETLLNEGATLSRDECLALIERIRALEKTAQTLAHVAADALRDVARLQAHIEQYVDETVGVADEGDVERDMGEA